VTGASEEDTKISTFYDLELRQVELLSRPELIRAIREKRHCLEADLLEHLEEKSTDHLQLLLLAARLVHVLRRTDSHA
jgi:hypothetical protein